MKKLFLLRDNSLWLVGLGLMLASSGIDGAYMARWMPAKWLGYVLNTTADIAGLTLMYWYGRLKQYPKNTKRHRMATALLPAEFVAIAYSWFFSWLQLRIALEPIEGDETRWIAPIAAGFIPLLNTAIGYAQALLSGRIEEPKSVSDNDRHLSDNVRHTSDTSIPDCIVSDNGHDLPDSKWTLADFVRHVSDPVGLSPDMQRQVADIAGVSPRTVRRWISTIEERENDE